MKKVVEYKLQTSVKEQMDNFLVGFYALISKDLITIFDEQELELLISGLPDIDVDDWKNNTTYVNYTATCKEVSYFGGQLDPSTLKNVPSCCSLLPVLVKFL